MKDIYKQPINQRDIKSSEKLVLCSACMTGVCSWRNDADSHWITLGGSLTPTGWPSKQPPSGQSQLWPVTEGPLSQLCITDNNEFYVCLGQLWRKRSLSSENKTFKPAITLTRFPFFFFFLVKALPKCPEAYQIWIWLHRLEWVSNQSTAISCWNLGLHPAWALSVQALCTPTHAVHGTTCAPIQRYGWWHIFAIRKFNGLWLLGTSLLIWNET